MHLLSLVQELVKTNKYSITVAFFKEEAQEARSLVPDFRALGVRVVDLNMKSRFDVFALLRLYLLMRQEQFGILHTHLFRADLFGLPIGKIAKIPALVSTVRNTENFFKNSLISLGLQKSYQLTSRMIAISHAVKITLVEDIGIMSDEIQVIHYGIGRKGNLKNHQNTEINIRQKFNISDNVPLIGTVGRLASQKGHFYLIEGFAIIKQSFPNAKLFIVGHDDEGLREGLEKQILKLNLAEEVFITGYLDGYSVINSLDVFVLPSLWEGLGLVLLEAMASSKPIIASRVNAIPEIVEDNVTGLLVSPRDIEGLAHAICLLLNDPERAKQLGENGRKRLEQFFTLGRMVSQIMGIYDNMSN